MGKILHFVQEIFDALKFHVVHAAIISQVTLLDPLSVAK
jgi:hypothetical protein